MKSTQVETGSLIPHKIVSYTETGCLVSNFFDSTTASVINIYVVQSIKRNITSSIIYKIIKYHMQCDHIYLQEVLSGSNEEDGWED